jgi:hypothetical protein
VKENDKRLAGGSRWFEYHCYEGEDSADAELWHHTHQKVEVGERVEGCDVPVYHVVFADGFEGDVFNDELVGDPSEFYRPDYKKIVGKKSAKSSKKQKCSSYTGVQAVSLGKGR